jgi:2-phospho-L-lactate guanylyltransferase (CobY/MobA/RfbA family)
MSSNEVTVLNADLWIAQPQELAQLLARASAGQVIPDPRGGTPAPDRMAAVTDPTYWSGDSSGLAEALADLAGLVEGPGADGS